MTFQPMSSMTTPTAHMVAVMTGTTTASLAAMTTIPTMDIPAQPGTPKAHMAFIMPMVDIAAMTGLIIHNIATMSITHIPAMTTTHMATITTFKSKNPMTPLMTPAMSDTKEKMMSEMECSDK